MSRIVTALFANRDEAEAARGRLAGTVEVESARVVAQDTVGALVGIPIAARELDSIRAGLARGDSVVVAKVAWGADQKQIVSAISDTANVEQQPDNGPKLHYSIGPTAAEAPAAVKEPVHDDVRRAPAERAARTPAPLADTSPLAAESLTAGRGTTVRDEPAAVPVVKRDAPPAKAPPAAQAAPTPAARPAPTAPIQKEEILIGEQRLVGREGAAPAGADERNFESQAPSRRLSEEEVRAGGLLKDRVIEVVEMREEPVISREVVVREEVMIRKTVEQRNETVRDTVRRTDVEVEEWRAGS